MYQISRLYYVRFLRYEVRQAEFFVILGHFLPFQPPNNPKNQNFEKLKKASGDIIILHMRIIKDNYMMHSSQDMKRDGQNVLSFWTVFLTFLLPEQPKKSKF